MLEIDRHNVLDYLRCAGRLGPDARAAVEPLAWGVSNVVLRISPTSGADFVLKQSRQRLRTHDEWISDMQRVYREADTMRALAPLLPEGVVPSILFEDRENFLFAMQAAPAEHVVWKAELLACRVDPLIAATLGGYLSAMHAKTAGDTRLKNLLGDRKVFDQLRTDPFYRRVAAKHPELAPRIASLIDEMEATVLCIVHADFSPKNVLIARAAGPGGDKSQAVRIWLVDFETGHYGDPAFDLGFFLSHISLKCVLHAAQREEFVNLAETFWSRYIAGIAERSQAAAFDQAELERRAVLHLAACMLSRIDGKSTVDYLPLETQREFVRRYCRELLCNPPEHLPAAWARLTERLGSIPA